jgi:hypothetical protein
MVHERAIPEVIDRVYRLLARRYHPDVAAPEKRDEAERRMVELNLAYQVLSDPEQRAEYDLQRRAGSAGGAPQVGVPDEGATASLLKCFNHPRRPSVAFCFECGRPICEVCRALGEAYQKREPSWRSAYTICATCIRRSIDLESRMQAGRRADPEGPWYRRPMGQAGVVLYYLLIALILGALTTVVFNAALFAGSDVRRAGTIATIVAVLYVALIALRLFWRTRCPNCSAQAGRVAFRRIAPWADFFSPHPVCPECGRHFRKQEVTDSFE